VRRRIGAGAFATVWLAYDEQLDCPVAIKVLAENWTEDLHVRQRFVEEGRFLRKVESPHVVSVYDAGELEDSRPFLVMSYADQGTLADRLDVEPLTVPQALHVIGQIGAGLHALHRRGVLHRDVKPANVLFRTVEVDGARQVSAMLGDLGLGKAMDMSSRLTMIGGTPSFIAPEQAQGEPLDGRADQFSLAALAYLMLAGRAPYDHASLSAAADPGPLPPLDNGLPDDAEKVLATALSKDRAGRYPDVPSFVEALNSALVDHAEESPTWIPVDEDLTKPAPRPVFTLTPRRAKRMLVAVGAAALLVGLGTGFAAQRLLDTEHTISSSTGSISVTVPDDWTRAVDAESWRPPGGAGDEPSVSAGDAVGWNENQEPGEGVFIGVLPGDSLPTNLPRHPECEVQLGARDDQYLGDQATTVEFTGCTDGGITIERVVQVNDDQLLWVQVRAADRVVAYDVIESIETSGL
jgi:serine/threonine protein kinase